MNLSEFFAGRQLASQLTPLVERYAGRLFALFTLVILSGLIFIGFRYVAAPPELPPSPAARPAVNAALRAQVLKRLDQRVSNLNEVWQRRVNDPF